MTFTDQQRQFLEQQHSAAMITLRADGTPVATRVGVALVDGKVWSSGTQGRLRTRHVRRDPRATLFVFEFGYRALSIESRVKILEGGDVPEQSVRLFRVMQGRPSGPLMWYGRELSESDFARTMVEEERLIYEFEPTRVYGGV